MKAIILLAILMSTAMAHSEDKLYITANGETHTATLEANESAEEFKKLLPLTIHMSDYGGWEKVGDLPEAITRNDRQMTAHPGDIMLYQGQSIVIFYGDNSWAYTPLGKLDSASAAMVKEFLKGSTVNVTFSLSQTSDIDCITSNMISAPEIFDINGRRINFDGRSLNDLPKGMYIIGGKKRLIK